jgi:hypothetical protein
MNLGTRGSSRIIPAAISFAMTVMLSACGGGGATGSANQVPVVETPIPPAIILGGTPSAPTFLSLDSKNAIDTNTFNNYFKYAGVAGERLVVRASLNSPLSDLQFSRCASNPGGYATQIHVYGSNNVRLGGACDEELTYQFTDNAVYVLNFEFPSNAPGFFNVASLTGATPVKFLESGSGSPVQPKRVNTASNNPIGANDFFNYFWISAVKDETIVVNTTLNQALSDLQKGRCASSSGAYRTQIRVYNSTLNQVGLACGEGIRFKVPESGNYVLQFHYGSQSAGMFNATKV